MPQFILGLRIGRANGISNAYSARGAIIPSEWKELERITCGIIKY